MRFAGQFGWTYPEIDALSVADANEIVETLNEAAGVTTVDEHEAPPKSGVLTEEEFARVEGSMRAFAHTDKPRGPW